MPAYVDALLDEAALSGCAGERVETVFVGGGTPSILPPPLFARLMTGLREVFDVAPGAECTSEANPGTVTAEWLDAAVSGGINRLSPGMQAAQPRLLRALGRIHTPDQVAESVRLARAAGIGNLNLDLMFGLPGQTLSDWAETLDEALACRPQHLSCYGLIPEEGTTLKADLDRGALRLPEEEDERAMYDGAIRTLAAAGFRQYEISNFALPGRACRHNIGYWTQVPYLGLGASAASMLPDPSGQAVCLRRTNPREIPAWLEMVRNRAFGAREEERINREEAMFETLMLGLRLTEGVSEAAFRRMHGISLEAWRGPVLRSLAERGLLAREGERWKMTRRGMDVQNMALVELMG